jgi:hypothetical protein
MDSATVWLISLSPKATTNLEQVASVSPKSLPHKKKALLVNEQSLFW